MDLSHVEAYFHIVPISTDYRRGLFSDKRSSKKMHCFFQQKLLVNCNYGTCKLLFNLSSNSSQMRQSRTELLLNDNIHPRTEIATENILRLDKMILRRAAWLPSSRTSTTGGSTSSTWSLAASSATTRRASSCPSTGWRR